MGRDFGIRRVSATLSVRFILYIYTEPIIISAVYFFYRNKII